jgi:hypothetical protein
VLEASGTNEGSSEFIRIVGPGGQAHVSLAPSELPTAPRIWKRFEYPIDSSTWTLDSGTWSGLLADVDEVRIDLEFFTDDEVIGLDNLRRVASTCGPIDEVGVLDPSITRCGVYSLAELQTIALNPDSGVICGLVRNTVGSGGGVYTVSGQDRGTFLHAYDRPADLLFDENGNGFIGEDYGGSVYRLEPDGTSTEWGSDFHDGDDDPYGMTFAPPAFNGPNVKEGDIIVSDYGKGGADQLWAFSPHTSGGERLFMPDPGSVDFYEPAASTRDTLIYMMNANDGTKLYSVDTLGFLASTSLPFDLGRVIGLVCDTQTNDLYAASEDSLTVYKIDPATNDVEAAITGFTSLLTCCLEVSTDQRRLWVVDSGRIYEFCLEEVPGIASVPISAGNRYGLNIYPNPSNPSATIAFQLGTSEIVRLDIFDVSGRRVRTLLNEMLPAGEHRVIWDGTCDDGSGAASGVYFMRLKSGESIKAGSVVLLK